MAGVEDLEQARAKAHRAWLDNPTPDTERALRHADDALRRERRAGWKAEGVTDADVREVFNDDEVDA